VDSTQRKKAELELRLRAAYSSLIRERRTQARIREAISFNPPERYVPGDSGSVSSFLRWLHEIGSLQIPVIKKKAEEGRWALRFTQPSASELNDLKLQDPAAVMQMVKHELQVHADGRRPRIRELEKRIAVLRQQLHVYEVEDENRRYGRQSVRLTKLNILMSILIPIMTLLVGLIVSLLVEAARPEIVQWIRSVLRLASSR